MVAAAREEAERLQAEARERAATLEQEASDRAAALERTTVANVEVMLADGTKQYERLRDVREQTADRLASVEAMIRQAREECSDEVARGAFKSARKAVAAAKRDNGAVEAVPATDGRKGPGTATRRRTAAVDPSQPVTAKPARAARARSG
jgi:hypothetical protein